jgi:hypothetical protein
MISVNAPQDVEDAIQQFLPTKEQVAKKRRMHRDLWFFKGHVSVPSYTSYWTYTTPASDTDDETPGLPISNGPDGCVYCDAYELRRGHSIFANSFITWKDAIFSDGCWGRTAYESILFDHDGEKTVPFRILTDTSEYVNLEMDQRNMNVFLGGGDGGDPDYTERAQGLTILNILSKACDGVYKVEWSSSGFDGDNTGDYENDVITIYNMEGEKSTDGSGLFQEQVFLRNYIDEAYKKWSEDPDGEFTGLIIGERNEDDLSNLVKETMKGETFFSIFVKPNWQDIMGGYWGYQRDELVDGTIVNGPRAAAQRWNKFRSQNEIDAALKRGIVLEREIR